MARFAKLKITSASGAHYDGRMHAKGDILAIHPDVADRFVAAGKGELLPETALPTYTVDALSGVVYPVVPDADPLHAARAGSLKIDDHPGLVAAVDAGLIVAPKRGRLAPDPAPQSTVEPDAAPLVGTAPETDKSSPSPSKQGK